MYQDLQTQTRNGTHTKQLILDAALELYSEKGYSNTSIRELVKKISKRESTVYIHYKNKEEILDTILKNYGLLVLINNIDKGTFSDVINDPHTFLKRLADETIAALHDEKYIELQRIMIRETFTVKKAREILIQSIFRRGRRTGSAVFKYWIEKGLIKPLSPVELFNMFMLSMGALQIEYLILHCDDEDTRPVTASIHQQVYLFWELIKK